MNEYYNNISKILKTLEQNLNLTNKSIQLTNNTTTVDFSQQNQIFNQVEESFSQLIQYLKEIDENESIANCISQLSLKFLYIFQQNIQSSNNQQTQTPKEKSRNSVLYSQIDKLAIFSLRALGYFLYSNQIVKGLLDQQIKEISQLIEITITVTKNKNICNYAIWCFSSQSFPQGPISNKLPQLYQELLSTTPFNSKTIENEILNSFNCLLQQNIQLYLNTIHNWLPLIFNKLLRLDNLINIIEQLKQILSILIEYYQKKNNSVPEILSKSLLEHNDEFIEKLHQLYDSKNESLAIQYWSMYTFFLGNIIFTNYDIVNKLVKIPENSFKHENKQIKIETFNSWKLFIEGASRDIDLKKEKKRLRLFMAPFIVSFATEKDIDTKKACFSSWMFLLKQFKQSLFEVFPSVLTPIFVNILKKTTIKSNNNNNDQLSIQQQQQQQQQQQSINNSEMDIADQDLGESALLLLVSITSPSQEFRKIVKQKLQSLYDIVLETVPMIFTTINASEWLIGNLEPFKIAIQSRFIKTSSNTIQPFHNEKIELWNGVLKRMSNIDVNGIKETEKYLILLKDICLFLQQLFEQMKIEPDDDNSLIFYSTIYKNTIQSIPNSILLGGNNNISSSNNQNNGEQQQYLIKNINGGKNYIPIDFFILNTIEFGFKLTTEQCKEHLQPLFEELLSITFSKPLDLSNRLNFILSVMNDNLDNELTLCYLFKLWSAVTRIVQQIIDRDHVLLSLSPSMINQILESVSNLLLWPLRAIAGTPYSNDNSLDPCKILLSNIKLWKNTLQSMHRTFSFKTLINPSISYIIQSIDDLKLTNHQNYYDFIISTLIPLLEIYDLSYINIHNSNLSISNNYQNRKVKKNNKLSPNDGSEFEDIHISNILINLNNLLLNCHYSKIINNNNNNNDDNNNQSTTPFISSLIPCFNQITNILKKCKSTTLCLMLLNNMQSSLILYIKDNKPNQSVTSKLDSQEKYQLTLINDSFKNLWNTTLEILIQNNIITSTEHQQQNHSISSYRFDSKLLQQLELLLICAFTSPINDIKEKVLYFWNETFGSPINSKSLIYPEKLTKTLIRLSTQLKDQISIQLPNFQDNNNYNNNGYNTNNKRSNEHLDDSVEIDESFDDFQLPNSQFKKVNNNNNKLLNQYTNSNNNNNNNNKQSLVNNNNEKKKLRISEPNNDQYVYISKPIENDCSTQSMTEHQLEIYEKQKLHRNSSTTFSKSVNNNINNINNINNNNINLEDENILGMINDLNLKLFENQSTQSLFQIQAISIEITNKINNILKNRLFK